MMAAQENRMKKLNGTQDHQSEYNPTLADQDEGDMEELNDSAKKLNQIILERSKDASLVITNLPPILDGQKAENYLSFCSTMTENITRLLFI
jgi:hypothetical protein